MTKIDLALKNLLDNHLILNQSEIEQASKSHTYVRDLLANKWKNDNTFPRLTSGDFLSGSYRRGTKIHPLDDVDILMVIDGSGLFVTNYGQVVDAEVRGDGLDVNPVLQHLGNDGLLSSRKVLDLFHLALKQSHPESIIRRDAQAVNLWLGSYDMGIDVVPCFHVVPRNGSQDHYYIPKGGDDCQWILTNPKIDERITDSLHKMHNDYLKGLIRIVKYWNVVFNQSSVRSYHLETVVWYVFGNAAPILDYENALIYFFKNCYGHLANSCPDATNLGGAVDSYIDISDRNITLENIVKTVSIINNGYMAGMATEHKRLEAWEEILGNKFIY